MPPRSAEEKSRRKLLHQQKQEARQLAKEKKAKEEELKKEAERLASTLGQTQNEEDQNDAESTKKECFILNLPEDPMKETMCFLTARDLGAVSMSCRSFNFGMAEARVSHLFSRLNTKESFNYKIHDSDGRLNVPIELCTDEIEVRVCV